MTTPTVLLIDDDRSLLDMYSLKFSLDGTCRLLTAESPEQGLALAESAGPDLILLDLVLPKREGLAPALNKEIGFAVLKELKTNPATKRIPVIVFTNLDEENQGNVERAKELGAADYWVKAKHQPAEVVEMVKVLLS